MRFATATCWGGTHFFWRRLEAASIFGEVVTFKFFGPGPLPEAYRQIRKLQDAVAAMEANVAAKELEGEK